MTSRAPKFLWLHILATTARRRLLGRRTHARFSAQQMREVAAFILGGIAFAAALYALALAGLSIL